MFTLHENGSRPLHFAATDEADLVRQLREASPFDDARTLHEYMQHVAARARTIYNAYVHTHDAAAFIADLKWLGLITEQRVH